MLLYHESKRYLKSGTPTNPSYYCDRIFTLLGSAVGYFYGLDVGVTKRSFCTGRSSPTSEYSNVDSSVSYDNTRHYSHSRRTTIRPRKGSTWIYRYVR